MIQKLNRRTAEVVVLKHFHDVFALAQERRGNVERVERSVLVVASEDDAVDAAESAVAGRNMQERIRRSIRNLEFRPEKSHIVLDWELRKRSINDFRRVFHRHDGGCPAVLELLAVEDDAVGDAFAVVLGVAVEVRACAVFHDDFKRAAVAGLYGERFVSFPDVLNEFSVVV